MNKIEKQYIKKEKKYNNSFRKWWRKNAYKIARVVFFYIWLPCFIYEKIRDTKYNKLTYNNNLTKKYLDHVLPKLVAHYEEGPYVILFHNCDDFGGIRFYWDLCSNWMRKKFKRETTYFSKFNKQVKAYILNEYAIEGYSKLVLDNYVAWEKAKEKFDWYSTPYNVDYAKGALFYKEQ